MATEISPSSRSLSLDLELAGRPLDNGLYTQSNPATAGQLFYYGKRILTFDGKVYKHGHAKTALTAAFLCPNIFPVGKHLTYAVLPVAIAVGDKHCTVTYPSSCGYAGTGFAVDELVGGHIVVGHGGSNTVNNRTIVANDAIGATTSTARIWVDGPFSTANAAGSGYGAEAYPNPYAYLAGNANTDYNGFMGVANVNTTAAYDSFIQTWGPCWVVPGSTSSSVWGKAAGDRCAFAIGDASVADYTTKTTDTYGRQIIGWTMDTTSASVTAMPLIMLQIST